MNDIYTEDQPIVPKKKYSILHPFIFSYFHGGLYRDIGQNWKGIGFLFIILLTTVSVSISTVSILSEVDSLMDSKEAQHFIDQIPPITINNGRVSSTVEQPFLLKAPITNKQKKTEIVIAILDTTGRYNSMKDTPDTTFALLTESELHTRNNTTGEIKTIPLNEVGSWAFGPKKAHEFYGIARDYLPWLLVIFLSIWFLVTRLLFALFYGAIGTSIASSMSVQLPLSASMRIAAVAMTPGIIAGLLMNIINFNLGCFGILIFILIDLAYLWFGISKNRIDPSLAQNLARPSVPLPDRQFHGSLSQQVQATPDIPSPEPPLPPALPPAIPPAPPEGDENGVD